MKRLFSSSPTAAEPNVNSSASRARKRTPQIGLSTMLLATAAIAAWGSHWLNRRQIEQLEQRVASMRALTRELVIKDRDHLAVVLQNPEFYDQQIWQVYVPHDALALHLVTRGISTNAAPQAFKTHEGPTATAPLTRGRHKVELKSDLEEDQWLTQVLLDDQPVITICEPKEWNPSRGSSGAGNYSQQADLPPDQLAVLFSRVFMLDDGKMGSKVPTGPSNGIALWIDELPEPPNRLQPSKP